MNCQKMPEQPALQAARRPRILPTGQAANNDEIFKWNITPYGREYCPQRHHHGRERPTLQIRNFIAGSNNCTVLQIGPEIEKGQSAKTGLLDGRRWEIRTPDQRIKSVDAALGCVTVQEPCRSKKRCAASCAIAISNFFATAFLFRNLAMQPMNAVTGHDAWKP